MDSYKCEPMTAECDEKGVWVNGHWYCVRHYKVTIIEKDQLPPVDREGV